MAKKARFTLSNWIMSGSPMGGLIFSSNEEDVGGVSSPRPKIVPGGSRIPDHDPNNGIKSGPITIYPRKPSKDAIKRGRAPKPNNFAR
jgi:hypothetical protein